jgi:hypothetical protein
MLMTPEVFRMDTDKKSKLLLVLRETNVSIRKKHLRAALGLIEYVLDEIKNEKPEKYSWQK